ncbi:hypothetical protein O7626_00515 [Micromonospora sp. WMMD1102]|uniref:hypothetical protein n=1 Tax=Micromonospora sp. WMMD1102 TaxID=3016105 RepID=UPI0024153FEA|nr:hypothetical protein [Micromonospora sp. WMMD1102]MDG4784356.1 hypothetical protein [Micromonospora sp. WMMD1102]MDG4784429.1 hypothetical protein [Micromonospora sp. WMMD1102]
MDIKNIRAALATAAGTVVLPDGTRLQGYARVPGSPDPPCAYPAQSDGTYGDTLDDTVAATVTLRILTGRGEDEAAQELLDALLAADGPSSVRAAIESDPTLGGLCSDLAVTGWSGYESYDVGGVERYGAELTVEVLG